VYVNLYFYLIHAHRPPSLFRLEGFFNGRVQAKGFHIGGDLVIESSPGNGSCFTLTVPISPSPAKTQTIIEGGQQKFPATEEIAESFGAIRVLFVDDHKMIRQGLVKMVSNKPGVQVVGEAANGLEALERARQLRQM
jgi:hypothetical protein